MAHATKTILRPLYGRVLVKRLEERSEKRRPLDPKCHVCFQAIGGDDQFVYADGDRFHGRCYVAIAGKLQPGAETGAVVFLPERDDAERVAFLATRGGDRLHTDPNS